MSICRMGESGLVIRLAHAQCSVSTEDGEQGSLTKYIPEVPGVDIYQVLRVDFNTSDIKAISPVTALSQK